MRRGEKGFPSQAIVNQDEFIIDGSSSAPLTLVLAHGAGAQMDSPFMAAFAQALAGNDLRMVRFEFPYMRARR
jgi:predicted alpha/beta-hydrolase family hydrolase